jgi:phage tail sheath protein FI
MQGMPAWRTVYDWVVAKPDFAARLARAREMGYDALAEEALEISNTPVMGQKQVMGDNKTYTTVEDMLGHRKLQIETRLKLLACWDPSKYGSRTTLAGDAKNPVVIDAAKEAKDLLDALLTNVELTKQAKVNG